MRVLFNRAIWDGFVTISSRVILLTGVQFQPGKGCNR
jgi:hypothetical protein